MTKEEALVRAIRSKDVSRLKAALDEGADPNAMVDAGMQGAAGGPASLRWPVLIVATQLGNREAVSELVRRGADVNARDSLGQTALMWLCSGACSTDEM